MASASVCVRCSYYLEYYLNFSVCGSFGFGNVGDEALPLAIRDIADQLRPGIEFSVVGRFDNPAIEGVVGLNAEKFGQDHRTIMAKPMLFSGGGIIEPQETATIFRCRKLISGNTSDRVQLFGASVEPSVYYNPFVKWKLRRALQNFSAFRVRDVLSAEIMDSIDRSQKTEVIGDVVLSMLPSENYTEKFEWSARRYIAVSLSDSWGLANDFIAWIGAELRRVSIALDAMLVFLPFSTSFSQDLEVAQTVMNKLRELGQNESDLALVDIASNPRHATAIMKGSILVIAQRLHGCVIAYAQKTPFVALGYHPKLSGFTRTVGWEDFMVPKQLPHKQSDGHYGFRFEDLQIKQGAVEALAIRAVGHSKFDMLEKFKAMQRSILGQFLQDLNGSPDSTTI